jgi:sporulation integral membrane protein YlbJ
LKVIYPILTAIYIIALLISPGKASSATLSALELWLRGVMPGLFPFFIGAELLERTGAFSIGARKMDKAAKMLLKCPGEAFGALLLCYCAGFPTGAKIIGGMEADGTITKNQARRLVSYGAVSSPGFVLAGVGITMLSSQKVGWLMLICHILSAIITGAIFSAGAKHEPSAPKSAESSATIASILTQAISKSGVAMIGIATAMALFTVINSVFFGDSGLSAAIFEMTAGCKYISGLPISMALKAALSCATLSFGGLSIMVQSSQFLLDVIPFWRYALSKTVHAGIGFLLCWGLSVLLL